MEFQTLFIGFVFGCVCSFFLINFLLQKVVKNKQALRNMIKEVYHKDLLPEICRAQGLVDLARRENHQRYADLAHIEITRLKERVIKIIKKFEPYQ
jgi:hypothetical protein